MAAEADLERHLRVYAEECDCRFLKTVVVGHRGWPDRMLIGPVGGHHAPIHVELKAPGEKPRANQQRTHDDLRRRGVRTLVVDSLAVGMHLVDMMCRN